MEGEPGLRALLEALAYGRVPPGGRFEDWQFTPVAGGANNRLYHVQGPAGDLAIKFTLRDRRLRATREHAALQALYEAGLGLAIRPSRSPTCWLIRLIWTFRPDGASGSSPPTARG